MSLSSLRRLAKSLQCPVDEERDYENTYWCNRDLIPIPKARRTWTWQDFVGYWVITGLNTTAWTFGSSLLSLGLSVDQAIGIVIGAAIFTGILAVVAGWAGSHIYLGFTVMSRASWGMRGGFWPVINRVMTSFVWMGIQLYWGGQAVKIILGAIIGPKFVFLRNTLPVSANVDTASLISFFVFVILFLPILLLPPEKLQLPFRIAFIMITCTFIGMLIWSLTAANGAGTLINTPPTVHGSVNGWNAIYAYQSVIGSLCSGVLGQSDWTRYSKYPRAQVIGQLVAAPLGITFSAVVGLLVTSATAKVYGEVYWNPLILLQAIQQHSADSPAARAGTFFAGLGFAASQVGLCIVTNSVAGGMDLASLMPKYINIRRGAYMITIVGIAICPWQYVTKPTVFITVLSGWSVFLSPMTGIFCSDYFLVRKGHYHVGDLYLGVNSTGAYWYTFGFNWRAFAAWCMGLWPLLPGFVRNIRGQNTGTTTNGWDNVYRISYFYGILVAGFVYWAASAAFPNKDIQGSSPFKLEAHEERSELEEKEGKVLVERSRKGRSGSAREVTMREEQMTNGKKGGEV